MKWYKIYAGLGGGFGGATYQGTWQYENEDQAIEEAYRIAQEEYESYEGLYGIASYRDCYDEAVEELGKELEEEIDNSDIEFYAEELYREELESWISYYVKEVTGPDNKDEDE